MLFSFLTDITSWLVRLRGCPACISKPVSGTYSFSAYCHCSFCMKERSLLVVLQCLRQSFLGNFLHENNNTYTAIQSQIVYLVYVYIRISKRMEITTNPSCIQAVG